MGVRAQIAKIRAQNSSAILRAQNSKFCILKISWKPHDGKFLETICEKVFGNYLPGNFVIHMKVT